MAKRTKKRPPRLWVRWEQDGDEEYALAWEYPADAVVGDGPTEVYVYELKEKQTLAKRLYQPGNEE